MKLSHIRSSRHAREDGQVLMLFGLFSLVLILFVGLGIDLGFAYITKAQLSKAMDAATLAAVSNYSGADKGAAANLIAENTFWLNYATNGVSGRATGLAKVTPVGTFSTDANSNLIYSNTVSATINTFLIGLLPQWKTLTVGDTAVASRAPVVMTLVIDRSGSMDPGGAIGNCSPWSDGGTYLPAALNQFISNFAAPLDRAALVTFATSSSNDVVMTTPPNGGFKTLINSAITRINGTKFSNLWAGHTCTMAGLTNALNIQNSVNVAPNYIKVVVLFTDGQANTITRKFTTTTPAGGVTLSFGGNDPIGVGCQGPNPGALFFRTNLAETATAQWTSLFNNNGCGNPASFTVDGTNVSAGTTYTDLTGSHFYCASSITEDATNRCVLIANQMRASSNYVYAVGLSASEAPPTIDMLQQVANDPDSSTFDPTQPVGAAFISSGQDLTEVFQQVAADIILRLVH